MGMGKSVSVRSSLIIGLKRLLLSCLIISLWLTGGAAAIADPTAANPNSSPQVELSRQGRQTVANLRRQAFQASQAGRFEEAEALWSDLLNYLPEEPAIWSNRGNVRVSQNKLEAALMDYDKAIELSPAEPDPYLNRGAALEGLERWEEAIASYSQVLAISPKDAAAYNNRGNAQAGLGRWELALEDFQSAIELNPNFALARVNAALALYQLGDTTEAIRRFRNLTRKYPNFPDARAALTAALWNIGQQGEAESNWVAVVGLDRRYRDLEWLATVRRWPPAMVAAMEKFLNL